MITGEVAAVREVAGLVQEDLEKYHDAVEALFKLAQRTDKKFLGALARTVSDRVYCANHTNSKDSELACAPYPVYR